MKIGEMEVSVIVPAYNAGDYIKKAVESALFHSVVSEVIIVEDKSSDDTLSICRSLENAHSRVHVYQHPDKGNHGAGASRNLGISKANSEFIAFLDADDYFLPNRFEKELEKLSRSNSIDGIYGAIGTHYYTVDPKRLKLFGRDDRNLTTLSHRVEPDELLFVLLGISEKARGYFSLDGLTVRKTLFERAGYFDTSLKLSQDTQLIIKMATKGRLVAGSIDEPVAMRGVHDSNRSTNQANLIKYRMPLYKSLYEWGVENGMPPDALDACKDKYLMWNAYSSRFVENVLFLLTMPKTNPRIYANDDQFYQVVQATFGNSLFSKLIVKLRYLTKNLSTRSSQS